MRQQRVRTSELEIEPKTAKSVSESVARAEHWFNQCSASRIRHPASVTCHPSSVICHPSSVARHPALVVWPPWPDVRRPSSSVDLRQPSVVRRLSSVIRRPSSVAVTGLSSLEPHHYSSSPGTRRPPWVRHALTGGIDVAASILVWKFPPRLKSELEYWNFHFEL